MVTSAAPSRFTARHAAQDQLPPVIVIGAGGHAKVLVDALGQLGRRILFVTEESPGRFGQLMRGVPIEGTDSLILDYDLDAVELVNGVGSVAQPHQRQQVFERFLYRGYRFATVIHPTATVSADTIIADGVQIMAGAVVQPGVLIGANTILNTSCSIDHDCTIGAHTHIAPGVTLSGNVAVGPGGHIGTGATVIQGMTVGNGALVGAGAVVVKDVAPGAKVVGVPARPTG